MKPLALLLLLLLAAACRAPAQPPPAPRYALLPLRNLSADADLPSLLTSRLRQVLEERGAEFVPEDELERILQARRIRRVDSASLAAARAIAEETGATHLLLGTLLEFEPAAPPRIALALRVVTCADGRRGQSALVALAGDDFTGLLGLGTITDTDTLVWEVVARAVQAFDARGLPRPVRADARLLAEDRPARPLLRYVDAGLELRPGTRVAIFPLVNRTNFGGAGQVLSEVLSHAWLQGLGVEVVEEAELFDAFVRARVRSLERIDSTALAEVARSVGARYLVLGSVEFYELEVPVEGYFVPELEVWLRLLEAETGRLVAGAALRRRGDDYQSVLGLGREHDAVRLALRTARELLATLSI